MKDLRPIGVFSVCVIPGSQNAVRRMILTDEAQERISGMIEEQSPQFLSETLIKVDFDPTYNTDSDSVLWISGFNGIVSHGISLS